MATAPTRRVTSRSSRRPAPRSGFAADCRWCKAPILWLRSLRTDTLAPLDAYPAPGGTALVHRDGIGRPVGTYEVLPIPRAPDHVQHEALLDLADLEPAGAYADLGGAVAAPEPDPTLHWNHWATCSNRTARNLAAARAADGGRPPGPLRTIDGDPVGARHVVEDALGPPPAHASAPRRCRVCFGPLDPVLSAAGERFHPTCLPDPGPEPDRA